MTAPESAYPIVVNSQLEPKGYRGALLTFAVFRLRLVGPVLAFFAFGALAARRDEQAFLLFSILFGIGLITWLWVQWQAHSPANTQIYMATVYRFSPEGIGFSNAEDEGDIPWEAFKRWRYMSGHYMLHANSASFIAIPSVDVDPDERGPLENLFSEKIRKGPRGSVR